MLDGGLPLTPKLLGYSHDADGNLVVNPDEAPTVKLIFYMYLYGYSTSDIAAALTELGRKTYLGNVKWTSNSIVQVTRPERIGGTDPRAFTGTTTRALFPEMISLRFSIF